MKERVHPRRVLQIIISLWVGLFVYAGLIASTIEFRVIYSTVPGIDKIVSGQLDEAIELLESRRRNSDFVLVPDELSTLCALYIVERTFSKAQTVCHAAVEKDQSVAAYNNRGVLFAHLGKIEAAIEDFDCARVQPEDMPNYLRRMGKGSASNAKLVASSNFEIAIDLYKSQTGEAFDKLGRVSGVGPEEIEI